MGRLCDELTTTAPAQIARMEMAEVTTHVSAFASDLEKAGLSRTECGRRRPSWRRRGKDTFERRGGALALGFDAGSIPLSLGFDIPRTTAGARSLTVKAARPDSYVSRLQESQAIFAASESEFV
jgi:hypothetical protein